MSTDGYDAIAKLFYEAEQQNKLVSMLRKLGIKVEFLPVRIKL